MKNHSTDTLFTGSVENLIGVHFDLGQVIPEKNPLVLFSIKNGPNCFGYIVSHDTERFKSENVYYVCVPRDFLFEFSQVADSDRVIKKIVRTRSLPVLAALLKSKSTFKTITLRGLYKPRPEELGAIQFGNDTDRFGFVQVQAKKEVPFAEFLSGNAIGNLSLPLLIVSDNSENVIHQFVAEKQLCGSDKLLRSPGITPNSLGSPVFDLQTGYCHGIVSDVPDAHSFQYTSFKKISEVFESMYENMLVASK